MIPNHGKYLSAAKDKIIHGGSLSDELLEFYQSLYSFQDKQVESFNDLRPEPQFLDYDHSPTVRSTLFALSDGERSLLVAGLEGLVGILSEYRSSVNLSGFYRNIINNNEIIEGSVKLLLDHDIPALEDFSSSMQISLEDLHFILVNWLKPYFYFLRHRYMDEKESSRENNFCPFCGYFSIISKIVESRENLRILQCGLCENEWEFARIRCAVCLNDNVDTMGYYIYEKDNTYRYDYCNRCKGYLKTILIPKGIEECEYDLSVENIITGFLDSSAIDMGYGRP